MKFNVKNGSAVPATMAIGNKLLKSSEEAGLAGAPFQDFIGRSWKTIMEKEQDLPWSIILGIEDSVIPRLNVFQRSLPKSYCVGMGYLSYRIVLRHAIELLISSPIL